MPNLASAKKNLRKSMRRHKASRSMMEKIQKLLKSEGTNKSTAQSLIDKAAKKSVLHKNKASRLISRLSRSKSLHER